MANDMPEGMAAFTKALPPGARVTFWESYHNERTVGGSAYMSYASGVNAVAEAGYDISYDEDGTVVITEVLPDIDFGKNSFRIEGKVLKADHEQRVVFGWASVIKENGEDVVDHDGDVIEGDTLMRAVNKFMTDTRVGKINHDGDKVSDVIHSLPLVGDMAKSLGLSPDDEREGWIIGQKIYSEEVWKAVLNGDFPAFSIGGRAKRRDV